MSRADEIDGASRRVCVNMKRRRLALKLSQDLVGQAMGVTQAQVAKYEQGASDIPSSKLVALTEILRIDANELLGIEPVAPNWATNVVANLAAINEVDRKRLIHMIEAFAVRDRAAAA
jgi:transcriptional regulator with XRE-family HTH domain